MSSVYALKHQQIRKICSKKHPVVQRFILILVVGNENAQKLFYAVFVKSTLTVK